MKQRLIILIMVSQFAMPQRSEAQCSTGVAPAGSCPQTTYAFSTVQTFQTTCAGILKNVVVPNISLYSDDLRASGYAVQCRIRSSSGVLLAASANTDQWYPAGTVTFDMSCANLYLTASTTYQLEFFAIPGANPNVQLILFCRSATSVYAGGTDVEDGVVNSAKDLYGWTVNLTNGNIASANSSLTQPINSPSQCTGFFNAANELMCAVLPAAGNGIAGSTTAKVWLETTQPAQYVKRHYEITPATNAGTAAATVTLYFTQAEFDNFNAVNTFKLPANGSDASGKSNLLIEKRSGISSNGTGLPGSYTGSISTIDPNDNNVVWNSGASRWEVTFGVTGFSGFFVKTISGVLSAKWLSISGRLDAQNKPVISWRVNEENIASYEIEKATDGTNFLFIGIKQGAGNGTNEYSFTEDAKLRGTALYRIRQTELNGRVNYSGTVKLSASAGETITVYPNPATDFLRINASAALLNTAVTITDATGRKIRSFGINSPLVSIPINDLAKGLYLLHFNSGRTVCFVKQ